jgi:hypothetical protein
LLCEAENCSEVAIFILLITNNNGKQKEFTEYLQHPILGTGAGGATELARQIQV